jgi:Kef-type K+ transport system membrane component KefB
VPRFGRIATLLFEAVIMLIAMVISARWVMRRFNVPRVVGSTVGMGLVALGILAPAEIAGVLWVRGLSLDEYLTRLVPRVLHGPFKQE